MMRINNIAVIGAGNMGSQIAAYLATLGFKVDLFDKILKKIVIFDEAIASNFPLLPKIWNDMLKLEIITSLPNDLIPSKPKLTDSVPNMLFHSEIIPIIEVTFINQEIKFKPSNATRKYLESIISTIYDPLKPYTAINISLSQQAWDNMLKLGIITSLPDRFLITPRNVESDLHCLHEADWVIEAVFENPQIKIETFSNIERYSKDDAIITSNTSGISIEDMLVNNSEDFKKRFFVTHFFNPVNMLPLLELVPGKLTDENLFSEFEEFAVNVLRKGVVIANDTPNFIANRYGVFMIMMALNEWPSELSVAEIDEIFKIICGWEPLKTCDIVGLQLLEPVAKNVLERVSHLDDPYLACFKPVEKISQLTKQGFTGRKSNQKSGFYAKKGKEKLMYDFDKNQYVAISQTSCASLQTAMAEKDQNEKLKKLVSGNDIAAKYANTCLKKLLEYAVFIKDSICNKNPNKLDDAMKWGYNWPIGPLELGWKYDSLGLKFGLKLDYAYNLPYCVDETDSETFVDSMIQNFSSIYHNQGAHVIPDKNTAVYVFFHSGPVNSINQDIINAINKAIDYAEKDDVPVVIINDNPKAFCAGADLKYVLEKARNKEFSAIEKLVRDFQTVTQRMTYCHVPVICAPHGMTLGGGSELAMAANLVIANYFVFWGQPELGVGLVPAGGGCMRMLKRAMENISPLIQWSSQWDAKTAGAFIDFVWRTIVWCKQSANAVHAQDLGFLRKGIDQIIYPGPNSQRILFEQAEKFAEILDSSCLGNGKYFSAYIQPKPFFFNLPGAELECRISLEADLGVQSNMFPKHNGEIAKKIAHILCGGNTKFGNPVSEQNILDLEVEAFMSLVGTEESQKMMAAVVEKRK